MVYDNAINRVISILLLLLYIYGIINILSLDYKKINKTKKLVASIFVFYIINIVISNFILMPINTIGLFVSLGYFVIYILSIDFFYNYLEHYDNLYNNENSIKRKFIFKDWIAYILFILSILVLQYNIISSWSNPKTDWEKLSPAEKARYERSYGNGKSKAIDDAIDDYKNNH